MVLVIPLLGTGECNANSRHQYYVSYFSDGVGEGQLQQIFDTEIELVFNAFKEFDSLSSEGLPPPKLTFIVVSKRIKTK